jgi:chain length determinant protein tyrosine kinase EpsG
MKDDKLTPPTAIHAVESSERSLGAILVAAGRLKAEDAERVFEAQEKLGLTYGDAAVTLGLITEDDINYALSRQFHYPYLQRGKSRVSETVSAAYDPFSPQIEALRALRSQLALRWFDDRTRKTLAIVGSDAQEGRSWLAANLAVVFSQLGERTLLIDMDLRAPVQHKLFGLDNSIGLSSILAGRPVSNVIHKIPSLVDLAILTAGPVPPNPQELLSRPVLGKVFEQVANRFDVILIDTPPASRFADYATIAARAGGALIITRQDQTRIRALNELCARLNDSGVVITGSVLNGRSLGKNKKSDAETSKAKVQKAARAARKKLESSRSTSSSSSSSSEYSRPKKSRKS